jgi:exopolysaccharide biosynthesis polyprenyl glycosylphosphotransferase
MSLLSNRQEAPIRQRRGSRSWAAGGRFQSSSREVRPYTHQAARRVAEQTVEQLAPVLTLMRREKIYRRFLACADGTGALAAIVIVSRVSGSGFRWPFLACPLLAILIAKIQGLYDRDDMSIRKATVTEWRAVLRTAALIGIASYLVWYTAKSGSHNDGLRVFASLVAIDFFVGLPLRGVARRLARGFTSGETCLIVGTPHRCVELARSVEEVEGVELVGTVSTADVECSVAGVRELVEELGIQRIIVGPHPESLEPSVFDLITSAKWLGVRISLMPTLMTVVGAATAVDEFDSLVLLGVPRFGLSRSSEVLKRALDLALGGLVLIVTLPVMLLVAVLVKVDSPGPALFRQKRIGRGGQPFTIYKFRSMVDGADKLKGTLRDGHQPEGLFKLANDPRITKVGRFLRKSYLDELPQLFNVLRGEMSLVGPRPLIESEDSLLQGHDRHRSRLNPGMTGPWQLRGPLNASLAELARLDYMYASNWSIWADIDILLGTSARMVRRHGH